MKINTDAQSVHEIFGYKTKEDMIAKLLEPDHAAENKKEVAMISLTLKLIDLGPETTAVLLYVLNPLTGLSIQNIGDLLDYLDKSLNEEEVISMSSRIVVVGGMPPLATEEVLDRLKKIVADKSVK